MLLLVISTLLKIAFVLGLIAGVAPVLVWAERRQSSMMQDRVGPVRAGMPLPMELWNLIQPAAGAMILAGWLMNGTLTPVYVVLGQPELVLDHGTMVYSWFPLLGPFLQLFTLDNPWYYDIVPLLSALTQVTGLALLLTSVAFKGKISVADFVKGPAAKAAGFLGRVALGYSAWLIIAAIVHYATGGDAGRQAATGMLLSYPEEQGIAVLAEGLALAKWCGVGSVIVFGALSAYMLVLRRQTESAALTALAYFFGVGAAAGVICFIIAVSADPAIILQQMRLDPGHVVGGNLYLIWSLVISLAVGVTHVPLGWVVRNAVDKRGHLTVFGLMHALVDVLKTAFKEDFVPPHADKLLHSAAPIIALIPAFATFAVIPFGPDLHWGPITDPFMWLFTPWEHGSGAANITIHLQVARINVGILYIFAIAGTGIVGAAIAGYSSDNKYSLLGGLRAASQMVSYEVTLGLTLVGCFMVYNTLLLDEMVQWQMDHVWGVVVQPLALVLFFFAAMAEMKRVPFDAPEGESEIVAGYMLEYSSMKFLMFMTGEFVEHLVTAGLIVTLFFGGYHLPFLTETGFMFGDYFGFDIRLPHLVVVLIGVIVFVAKMAIVMFLQLQVRWTLPRFRYDQTMQLCWKIILPLSLANILVTGVVILMLQ